MQNLVTTIPTASHTSLRGPYLCAVWPVLQWGKGEGGLLKQQAISLIHVSGLGKGNVRGRCCEKILNTYTRQALLQLVYLCQFSRKDIARLV